MIFDLNIILIFILLSSNIVFAIFYFQSVIKLREITKTATELFFTNYAMQETSNLNNQLEVNEIHQESFIKFLSDSRDWAFDYIDKVQKELTNFIEIADKEFAYFDSFGILTQEYPNYDAMKIISTEYKKLKDLLPKDIDDRR